MKNVSQRLVGVVCHEECIAEVSGCGLYISLQNKQLPFLAFCLTEPQTPVQQYIANNVLSVNKVMRLTVKLSL